MAQDTKYMLIRPLFIPEILLVQRVFKGRVKEAVATDYAYVQDSLKNSGYTQWKFNEQGQLNHFSWQINGRGDRRIYTFNDDQLLTETNWYNDATNQLYTTTRYLYNDNNLLKRIDSYDKDGSAGAPTVYNFEKDSLYPVEILKYGTHSRMEGNQSKSEIILSTRNVCQYDTNNNLIYVHEYNEQGEHQISCNWVYDDNNRCIGEGSYFDAPELQFSYELDEEGLFLVTYYHGSDGRELRNKNKYENGKLVHQACFSENKVTSEEEWRYDPLGNVVYNRKENGGCPIQETSFSYEYDSIGNWTKRISSVNNVKQTLIERVLTYY